MTDAKWGDVLADRGFSRFRVPTWSGLTIDLAKPSAGEINLIDIAVGLARTPRFNGATRKWYSVAQHSVIVAEIAMTLAPEAKQLAGLVGLFHDAAEAYVGDLIGPMKRLLRQGYSERGFTEIEAAIARAIFTRFGVDLDEIPEILTIVGQADAAAFRAECRDLLVRSPLVEAILAAEDVVRYERQIEAVGEREACRAFLEAWETLSGADGIADILMNEADGSLRR